MNKVKFLVATLLGVLFVACSEEENLSQTGKTGFLVSLAEDVKVESRSTPEEIGKPVASQFNLKITNQATGSELYNDSFTNQLIPASAGTYEIEATYGDNPVLALDAPYYKGTTEAELADGESKTVNVECSVANALASVTFDNSGTNTFESQFAPYGVRVSVDTSATTLTNDGKSAYYRAGSTPTFEFRGILKDGGEEVVQTLTDDKFSDPATFAAGAHCVITLKIGAVEPGVKIEITKVEVKEVTVSETIPMEWLPKPKVTATGFDSNNTLAFVETEQKQAALNLDLSSALQDIKFKFNFEDEQFASLEKEKEYLLSTDKVTIEQALGITLPSIGDKPESIDLSGLIAKLQTNAGVPTNNSIEIDVQANNRWSSDAIEGESTPNLTYTLTCNKPEFTVDAYPGNIWTKEFTVNALREEQVTSGDFTKLSSDMTYQYSADGQTGWTNLSDGMRQDQLQSGTTYYIRGLYRGAVPGEVAEVSTYPETPLEYGDMEEWNTITKKLCVGTNVFNWRDVYGNSPNNNIWACVNAKTFEGDPNVYSTFNLNPSTYSVEGRSGKAAALRTVGWDNNWGNTSSLIRHIAAGKLFIGKYSFVHEDGPETYDYGMSYSSRPTSVEFYYTYSPYNGDSFKVWVVLENRSNDGNVTRIGYGELTGSESITSFTHNTISIEYSNIYLNITHMYIVFSSSANCSDVEETENNNLQGMVSEGNYHNGSVLTIDDVQLIYEK